MCQATGKRWADYWRNQQTQEFIASLARQLNCENSHLLQSDASRTGGTWVHRRGAIHLAQWCSPDFAVWLTGEDSAQTLASACGVQPATRASSASEWPLSRKRRTRFRKAL
ncbi:MAG: hypothetical protein Aurels2KO_28240 [Aureliella sp.]